MKHVLVFLLFAGACGNAISGGPKDLKALQQALRQAETTLPGDNLEDLAELSSEYVIPAPAIFLRAQSDRGHCFGVNFLGVKYVDDLSAQTRELAARRKALESITDPELASARLKCLRELTGS